MRASVLLRVMFVAVAALALPGCEVVGDIFKAGMAVGFLLILAFVVLIVFLIAQVRRRV